MKYNLNLAALAICLLLVAAAPQAGFALTAGQSGTPKAISLSVIPSSLPADGGTYQALVVSLMDQSSLPSATLSSITVYLSSSQENVAKVSASVTIGAGNTFAVASLTTTVTGGFTTITASSPGLISASASFTTAIPSGFPTSLKVFLSPDTVIARPDSVGNVIVELVDQLGQPAKASSNTVLKLSSTYTRVANLSESSVTLVAGSTLVNGTFTTTYVPGIATISAVATGLISGSALLTVTGPQPLRLEAFALPSVIPLNSKGRLAVALTDASGSPARAPYDIVVQIRSSTLGVATAPLNVTIPAGSIYVVTSFATTGNAGNATFTLSSTGLSTAILQVGSRALSNPAATPASLRITVGPTLVLADEKAYNALVVSLVDAHGKPTVLQSGDVVVQLASSNSQIGSVSSTVVIPAGANFVNTTFTSTYLSGQTYITASASNFYSDQVLISSYGPAPVNVKLKGVPGTLPADGNSYRALEVLLEDASGNPAVAPTDVSVQLVSSKQSVVGVDSSVTIPAGSAYALTDLTTSVLPGSANITAFSLGYSAAGYVAKSLVPAPSALAAFLAPSHTLTSNVAANPLLAIQLQDLNGNPARARVDTQVTVTSSNSQVLVSPISLTIPKGADYILVPLAITGDGLSTLTLISPGLSSSSTQLQASALPLTAKLTPTRQSVGVNQTAPLKVSVSVEGVSLQGVEVDWNVTFGHVSSGISFTGASGTANASLFSSSPGQAKVTAVLKNPALGNVILTGYVIFALPPTQVPPTLLQRVLSLMVYILVAVAIVIAAVMYVVLRNRRRRAREELEAGFQTLS